MHPDSDAPSTPPQAGIYEIAGWRLLVLLPLSLLLRLWCRTLRFSIGCEDEAVLRNTQTPTLILFWHNRLFVATEVFRRYRKTRQVSGLISASKDGAWLAAFYKLLGIGIIRGSSSWRGAQALQGAIHALRDKGHDIGITPDGPRGPCYSVKQGPAYLASKTQAPLLLVSSRFSAARRLKSWDKFYIPLPFSKVELYLQRYENIEELSSNAEDTSAILKEQLDAITQD